MGKKRDHNELLSRISELQGELARCNALLRSKEGSGGKIPPENLQESMERFSGLLKNMSELIIETNENGVITYLDERSADTLGYSLSELPGRPLAELLHPNDQDLFRKRLKLISESPVNSVDVWRFKHKIGTYLTLKCRASSYRYPSGETRFLVIAYDISARAEKETENQKIRYRLNRAEKVARLGHWELDLNSMEMIGSEGALAIYGLQDKRLLLKTVQNIPLPEYRSDMDEALDKLVRKGIPYDLEFQIRRESDGKILDIHSIAEYDKKRNLVFGVIQDITEQKKARREQKASEDRFRTIIQENPIPMIIIDKQLNILTFNRKFTHTFGYTADTVKTVKMLWKKMFPDPKIRKKKQKQLDNILSAAVKEGKESERLVRDIRCNDGSVKTVEFHFVSSGDVNVISMIDITGILETQVALRDSEERLRMAIHASGYGLYELNLQTFELSLSNEVFQMLGYNDPGKLLEFRGSVREMIHPEDANRVTKLMSNYVEGGLMEFRDELRFAHTSRGWIWVMWSGKTVSFTAEGRPERMIGILADITQIKNYEIQLLDKNRAIASQNEEYAALNEELQSTLGELQETNRKLEVEKERAQESDRLKSAFLANMSHEIRTPMNSILGFSELLVQEGLTKEKREKFTSLISTSGEQLMRLINDIIDISKIESNQLRIEKDWCNINEFFEKIMASHLQHHNFREKKGLLIRFRPPVNQADPELFTDCFRLKQILDNLLNNAIKFTETGFIELGYNIIEQADNPHIEFYVQDTGSGISAGDLEKVFIRFTQAESSARIGGTGLGLSITKGLVELLGGEISVESSPGNGSVFRFTHPLEIRM